MFPKWARLVVRMRQASPGAHADMREPLPPGLPAKQGGDESLSLG